ncbi:hypothetical protein BDR03DRAFT_976109 [Suillus americanus]|nr:hypothetical protein BDR03DRAFT_976109 [Suillus americanus]
MPQYSSDEDRYTSSDDEDKEPQDYRSSDTRRWPEDDEDEDRYTSSDDEDKEPQDYRSSDDEDEDADEVDEVSEDFNDLSLSLSSRSNGQSSYNTSRNAIDMHATGTLRTRGNDGVVQSTRESRMTMSAQGNKHVIRGTMESRRTQMTMSGNVIRSTVESHWMELEVRGNKHVIRGGTESSRMTLSAPRSRARLR